MPAGLSVALPSLISRVLPSPIRSWHTVAMSEPQHEEIFPGATAPATKGDLHELRQEIAALKEEIFHHFDAAVENIVDDMKGANADEIALLKAADNRLHERVAPLEQQAGYEPPPQPHPL